MDKKNWIMLIFMGIVTAHWLEHIFQAVQVYILGWPVAHADGALGHIWHGAADNEWIHWGYAAAMLFGLVFLYEYSIRTSSPPMAQGLWLTTVGMQAWHSMEHTWLLTQFLMGEKPVSFGTVWFGIPRMELHLLYNTVITLTMLVALAVRWYQTRPYKATEGSEAVMLHMRGF